MRQKTLSAGRVFLRFLPAAVAVLTAFATRPAAGSVLLVLEGEPRSAVVTAAEPTPTARYAARELVEHVRLATGAELPVVTEADIPAGFAGRIYIGATAAAARLGLVAEELGPDVFVLKTRKNELYILGREDPEADPLALRSPWGGTLFGVYELLERYLGVRWLWPGELGTFAPRAETVIIPVLDETVAPALRFRRFRASGVNRARRSYPAATRRLAFSREGLENYARDLGVFLRRHRLGDSERKPTVGHYFSNWWRRHGEENPEWFMMNAEGTRGPGEDSSVYPLSRRQGHVAMCVSNPDLHRFIVDQAWDGESTLRLGEVDLPFFCQCPECLAWDRPRPDEPLQVVSDRYARFWRTILEMAAERNPEVTVTTFVYWNYLPAPLEETRLDRRIYGEFVPWTAGNAAGRQVDWAVGDATWYPMTEAADRWLREQWLGWHRTGITMGYRPNHTLAGYAMPNLNIRQGGEFFRFAWQHGMVGTDFDSLVAQWAVRGPEHYMYFRLFVDPRVPIEEIVADFFAAFGPAAGRVREYFDFWEDYNHRLREEGRWSPGGTHAYTPEIFAAGEKILAAAGVAAAEDPAPEFAARVSFLQAGLEHARLCAALFATLGRGLPEPGSDAFQAAQAQLRELIAFRRAHEHLYIADYIRLAGAENRRFQATIDALLE